MILRLAAVSFLVGFFALPLHYQCCEAEDHQPAAANVQKTSIPASVTPSSPGLPPTATKADYSGHASWNYWDAVAPSTWNGWVLAIVGGLAAWAAVLALSKLADQVETEKSSVDLMRKEYAATHRPRIRVRDISIDLAEMDPANADKLCEIRVGFYVVNYGESEALLANAQYSVTIGEQLPMLPIYQSEFMSNLNREALASGEGAQISVTGKQYRLLAVFRSNHPLFVIGYIDYRGTAGVTYRTAFARHFDANKRMFVKVQNPDYEYEE